MQSTTRVIVKRFWGLCAFLVIALAVVVQLGREFAPSAAQYKDEIAARLSEALGAEVRINRLEANWDGLSPELRLSGIGVRSLKGESILRVAEAQVELDLLRSLLNWRLALGDLEFVRADLAFRQNEQGIWSLVGLEGSTTADDFSIDDPLDVLLLARQIEFQDATFSFQFRTGHSSEVAFPRLTLDNQGQFHRLSSTISVNNRPEAVLCLVEWEGDPRNRESFVGGGYIRLQDFELDQAVAALPGDFWDGLPDQEWRQEHDLDLEAWFEVDANYQVRSHGRIDIGDIAASLDRDYPLPKRSGANFMGVWRQAAGWDLSLRNLVLDWGEAQAPMLDLKIASDGLGQPVTIQTESFELQTWIGALTDAGLLQGKTLEILDILKPTGELLRPRFTIAGADLDDLQLEANLRDVSVQSWRGTPALTGLNGYLQASPTTGLAMLDSGDGFSMLFPTLYQEPMIFDSAKGEVRWAVDREAGEVLVRSGPLQVDGDLGQGEGSFRLRLPFDLSQGGEELILQIGARGTRAVDQHLLVPKALPDALREWIDMAAQGGYARRGGFLYRGGFTQGAQKHAAIQLFVDVADGELKFHPDWPALRQASGHLWLDDRRVTGQVDSGRLFDSEVSSVDFRLEPAGEGMDLNLQGALEGDAGDGLRLLRETSLAALGGEQLEGWEMEGALAATVELSLPITGDSALQAGSQKVKLRLDDARLTIPDLKLDFQNVTGDLRYSDSGGLQAEGLRGRFRGNPIEANIDTNTGSSGSRDDDTLVVSARGDIAVATLKDWFEHPALGFLEGATAVSTELRLPAQNAGQGGGELRLHSSLAGLSIDLPAPLGKAAADTRTLDFTLPLAQGSAEANLRYGDQLRGRFALDQGRLVSGALVIGPDQSLTADRHLAVRANLPSLHLAEWQAAFERYKALRGVADAPDDGGNLASPDLAPEEIAGDFGADLPLALDLSVAELSWENGSVEDIRIRGDQTPSHWRFQVESAMAQGRLTVFNNPEQPLVVDLDYLRLPENKPEQPVNPFLPRVREDQLLSWEPSELPALDFSTKEFTIGPDNYGSWSFELRPTEQGAEFREVIGTVRGGQILGAEAGTGAHLSWTKIDGQMQTQFRGQFLAGDLGEVMRQWNQPQLLQSEEAVFVADLSWPGSPAAVEINKLQGNLLMHIEEGSFFRDEGSAGRGGAFLQLISIFNFDLWVRRLRLDFSDLARKGLAYSEIHGDLTFDAGKVYFAEPVIVEAPSSRFQMAGMVNLQEEELDTRLIATLPVGGNLTFFTALAAGLPAALGVYVISKVFKKQMDKVASVSYKVSGSLADPNLEFDRLFDDEVEQPKATQQAQQNGDDMVQQVP